MAYLPDWMLSELCEKHGLVEPYDPGLVNPASMDLKLGRDFVNLSDKEIIYQHCTDWEKLTGFFMGRAKPGERFVADSVDLYPGVALLATTAERIVIPDDAIDFESGDEVIRVPALVADVKLKSSAARSGLDHALAGWVDCGFGGPPSNGSTLTLEFHAHRPIELVAGKCYVQLCVATMLAAPRRGYQQTGRYVGEAALGAVESKGVK